MKNTLLLLICAVLFAACNKNQVVPTTVTIISGTPLDTLTLTDNGVTYIDTESTQGNTGASITIEEQAGVGYLFMTTFAHAQFPIDINFQGILGPTTGAGLYAGAQNSTASEYIFHEVFNGGEAYTVDSVAVNLTVVSGPQLAGTYMLWLSNSAGSKTVSGVIKYHHQ